jgi:glycosyltransferase involved in cell wall biosynthesis
MYRGNVPATVAARLAGVRRVWGQVHNINTWETRRQAWVDRALCRWRAGMIGVSERVCRDIERTLRLPPERVRLIHNGVNLERFGRGEGRSELRAEWGVGPDDVVILFAGRMVEPKRPGDFLDVARRLQELEARRGGSTRLHFVLAGDGPLLPPMRERAASLPAPERARLLGRRDDMPRVMAAADLFILPSSREGFSNALLEAMASGLAIVATDVGGNVEAVRDGLDGRIVPAGDLEALRRETERIAFDADARRAFAESARARAREFSLEAMIDKLQSLYEEPAPERK